MDDSFAQKFRLALDALSISRGRFASEMGVDKSLVGRWASGSVGPSAINLERITRLLATKQPGFTLLDWKGDLPAFARRFGVAVPNAPDRSGDAFHASLLGIIQPSMDSNLEPYEGFWRTTHASLFEPGRFCQQHGLIRRARSGVLEFEGGAEGIRYRGAMFPVASQLYAIGGDDVRNIPSMMIMNVMAVPKINFMDGLVLTANSPLRIPSSYPVVFDRIDDLSGDRARDDARMADLMMKPEALEDPSVLPIFVREHLLRDSGPEAARKGGDAVLSAPVTSRLSLMMDFFRTSSAAD